MKTKKRTREDCRGGVFSGQVIVGYPRKTVRSDRKRKRNCAISCKKNDYKESQNQID